MARGVPLPGPPGGPGGAEGDLRRPGRGGAQGPGGPVREGQPEQGVRGVRLPQVDQGELAGVSQLSGQHREDAGLQQDDVLVLRDALLLAVWGGLAAPAPLPPLPVRAYPVLGEAV